MLMGARGSSRLAVVASFGSGARALVIEDGK